MSTQFPLSLNTLLSGVLAGVQKQNMDRLEHIPQSINYAFNHSLACIDEEKKRRGLTLEEFHAESYPPHYRSHTIEEELRAIAGIGVIRFQKNGTDGLELNFPTNHIETMRGGLEFYTAISAEFLTHYREYISTRSSIK